MKEPKFKVNDIVLYNRMFCTVKVGPIKYGDFYIYDLVELEFKTEFDGVFEEFMEILY